MLWDACLAVTEDDDATGHVGENRLDLLLRVPAMGYHLAGWPVARDAPPVRVGTLVPLTYEPCWRCPRRLGSDACDPAVLQAFYRLHVLAMFSMQPLRLQMFLLDQARAGVVPENTVTMLRNFTETPGMPQTCCLALLPLQVVHWVCDRVACAVAYVQGVLPDGAMFTDVPLGACGASAAEVECAMFRLFYDARDVRTAAFLYYLFPSGLFLKEVLDYMATERRRGLHAHCGARFGKPESVYHVKE